MSDTSPVVPIFINSAARLILIILTSTLLLIAKRWLVLKAELIELHSQLQQLTLAYAPNVRVQFGVGRLNATTLIVAASDNSERLRSEAALATLCGVSPLQPSSAKTAGDRPNRGGNRQNNNALWTIALVRTRSGPRTRAYLAKERQNNCEQRNPLLR